MDIFRAEFDSENNLRSVSNMKSPINSPNDDFGIIFEGKKERGYFSSNRVGSKGDDIYQFVLPLLDLSISGVASDESTNKAIAGAVVIIIGTDGTKSEVVTDNAGFYSFGKDIIKEGVAYELTVKKEGYLTKNATQTTLGIKESKKFDINISLEPTQKEIILPRIEYDYNSAELRLESKQSLDALIYVLNKNPNVVIQLRSHTDTRAGTEFNLKLSQERAQICVDYMVSKGIQSKRLKAIGMGKSEPYTRDVKNGKLKKGDVLNDEYISKLKRKKNIEKAHQYNRRTDFKVMTDLIYDIESNKVKSKRKK
jgi:peptidoglycan-associated lipoprotein